MGVLDVAGMILVSIDDEVSVEESGEGPMTRRESEEELGEQSMPRVRPYISRFEGDRLHVAPR